MRPWGVVAVVGFLTFTGGAVWRIVEMGWSNAPGWLVLWTFGTILWMVGWTSMIAEKSFDRVFDDEKETE